MSKQTINIGASPNDGTGTPLRTSFDYTNQNFTELYTAVGPSGNNIVVPGNATITGDLTVDTSTLKVDSANDRVGIQSTLLNSRLTVRTGTIAGIDIYRDDANANFSGIRFKGTANSTVNAQIGWNGTQLRLEGTDEFLCATNSSDRFRISSTGVFTFETVGGVAGTAMTLNSTGLGIGASPATKLDVRGANNASQATFSGTASRGLLISTRSDGLADDRTVILNAQHSTGSLGQLVIQTAGTDRLLVDADGNVAIGAAATGTRRLELKSVGTNNLSFAAHFRDSADTVLFHVRSDGYFNTGQGALSPYSNTTASAANMFVDSSGFVYRSTSSLKYKTEVKDSIHGLADVLKLRSVTYKSKNGDDTVFGGLIAEEVHAAGLTEFVAYAPDKTPDSINYGNMVALLVSAIQELTAEVNALKNA